MTQLATNQTPNPAETLTKALLNAGQAMGLSRTVLGQAIGRDRTLLSRPQGVQPDTKAGELALMLIRCYRSLFVLVGGDPVNIKHWMHTENFHTGGVPAEQIKTVSGLARVLEYLDAMRGKN